MLGFAVNILSAQSVSRSGKLDDALKDFKVVYEKELKDAGIVGSTFVFLKDNKVIAKDMYGSANLEKNQPVDENTIFRLPVVRMASSSPVHSSLTVDGVLMT